VNFHTILTYVKLGHKNLKNLRVSAWNRFAEFQKRKSLIIGEFNRITHAKTRNFIEK